MSRSGYNQSQNKNIAIKTTVKSNNSVVEPDNSIVTLMAASNDVPIPFMQGEVCATRNATNHILMTWNAQLINRLSMYKIYRIITPNNPANADWIDNWDIDSRPTSILDGLGSCSYKTIDVDDGDLYEDWVDADTYEGYYVSYLFIYSVSSNYYGSFMYCYRKITNYCIADSPSISYNQSSNSFTIGTAMSGRRILEFHRTDRSYGYPTSITNQDTLNEMLLTSMIKEEQDSGAECYLGYYNATDNSLERWAKGTYSVGVNFRDNTNKSRISAAINSALSEINSVLNSYGVYFKRSSSATSGDITITVDTEYNLYGLDPFEEGAYVYGGTWKITGYDRDGYITSASVMLANDYFDGVPYNTYEQVAIEELSQAMGAGYDQYEYTTDTIHVDFNYLNKPDYLTTNDKNILRLLYSDAVTIGSNCTAVSKALNIPKGVYLPSNSTTDKTMTIPASFLDTNAAYAVRVFIVNSRGKVSYTSNWISISTPDVVRPENWEWQTDIRTGATIPFSNGAFHPVTAAEWNTFTKRINEFRKYRGLSNYSFRTVSVGDTFTAQIYNEAVAAIKEISGYGTYLSNVVSGSTNALNASLYTILRDELNAIP